MSMRKILVDDTNRELCPHGTESFPMTVSHDDLWDFEGKSVPIHWHILCLKLMIMVKCLLI